MLRLSARPAFALLALLLTCCGSSTVETNAAGGAAGNSAGSGSGPSGAGSSSGAAAYGGSGGAGGGGAPTILGSTVGGATACSSYTDDKGWSLTVHIKNQMSQTLYLGQEAMTCQAERLFQVQDGARTPLLPPSPCVSSCQALMTTGSTACPLVCASPSTVTLAPGQSLDLPWDGRFGVNLTLPQQCLHDPQESRAACQRAQQVEAGFYTFLARAGTSRTCPSGVCTCSPNASGGGCTTAGSLITGTIFTSEFLVALEPGAISPGGESQYIGIVFKD
jgi:hypothetical protein